MRKTTATALAALALAGCSINHTRPSRRAICYITTLCCRAWMAKTRKSPAGGGLLNLEFGESLHVSGAMCSNLFGGGQLRDGVLTVKPLATTRRLCPDEQRNRRWDRVIGSAGKRRRSDAKRPAADAQRQRPHALSIPCAIGCIDPARRARRRGLTGAAAEPSVRSSHCLPFGIWHMRSASPFRLCAMVVTPPTAAQPALVCNVLILALLPCCTGSSLLLLRAAKSSTALASSHFDSSLSTPEPGTALCKIAIADNARHLADTFRYL